jgi:hypothetical protein
MRRYLLPLLIVVNLALAGVFAWQWITPHGQLRDVQWVPPQPIKPNLSDSVLPSWSADLGSFIASLDRPLFSSTRKPPVKPEAAAAAAAVVVDTLADVRVLGLYASGDGAGGAIVRAAGKVQRLRQGDILGGWTVKEIQPRELVLARGEELRRLDVKRGPDVAADSPAGPGIAARNVPPTTAQHRIERAQQDADASKAAINALRARSGMPLLP